MLGKIKIEFNVGSRFEYTPLSPPLLSLLTPKILKSVLGFCEVLGEGC